MFNIKFNQQNIKHHTYTHTWYANINKYIFFCSTLLRQQYRKTTPHGYSEYFVILLCYSHINFFTILSFLSIMYNLLHCNKQQHIEFFFFWKNEVFLPTSLFVCDFSYAFIFLDRRPSTRAVELKSQAWKFPHHFGNIGTWKYFEKKKDFLIYNFSRKKIFLKTCEEEETAVKWRKTFCN